MVFITEGFFEVAIKSWPEWDIYIYYHEIRGMKYYICFHYFKFHVFTPRSSGEYRCYTNFYRRYSYYITVIDQ